MLTRGTLFSLSQTTASQWLPAALGRLGRGQRGGSGKLGKRAAAATSLLLPDKVGGKHFEDENKRQNVKPASLSWSTNCPFSGGSGFPETRSHSPICC